MNQTLLGLSLAHLLLLLLAGLLAGVVGTAGGITSLVSFPALLAVGVAPLPASMTNSVALVASWPGSALASRTELRGQAHWLLHSSLAVVLGALVGAVLLLFTSPGAFAKVVPFLVALGALALLGEPQLSAWRARRKGPGSRFLVPSGLAALSVYNSYFGAGAGVMALALMLVAVDHRFPVANALKNMLVGLATAVSALAFALFGPVRWDAALVLTLGVFAGSTMGPTVARHIPSRWIRVAVGLSGLGLAVRLWLAPV